METAVGRRYVRHVVVMELATLATPPLGPSSYCRNEKSKMNNLLARCKIMDVERVQVGWGAAAGRRGVLGSQGRRVVVQRPVGTML